MGGGPEPGKNGAVEFLSKQKKKGEVGYKEKEISKPGDPQPHLASEKAYS